MVDPAVPPSLMTYVRLFPIRPTHDSGQHTTQILVNGDAFRPACDPAMNRPDRRQPPDNATRPDDVHVGCPSLHLESWLKTPSERIARTNDATTGVVLGTRNPGSESWK